MMRRRWVSALPRLRARCYVADALPCAPRSPPSLLFLPPLAPNAARRAGSATRNSAKSRNYPTTPLLCRLHDYLLVAPLARHG